MLVGMRFLALLFFGGAVTLDLFFLFRFSGSEHRIALPFLTSLKGRAFTLAVTALALGTTLIFTVPNQLIRTGVVQAPRPNGLFVGSLIYALVVALVVFFALTSSRSTLRQLFSSADSSFNGSLSKGILYGIAAIPPVFLITVLMSTVIGELGFISESQPVIEWLINPETSAATRIVIVICAVVVAPLIEEIIFRGILFPAVLKNHSFIFSALLVGCIFSLIHFHAPSFLSILVLNIFFCAGYASTGSLVTPIVMHMIFNGTATCFALLV